MSDTLSSAFADTKPHYNILDGLRGVAALTVVCFHLFPKIRIHPPKSVFYVPNM